MSFKKWVTPKGAKPFKKGVSWNPKWRPRKGICLVNEQMKEAGYSPAKKMDIEETYLTLMQLSEKELNEFINDKKAPMLVRIIWKNMKSKNWFDVIEKMLDRWIGKATQVVETDLKVEVSENPLEKRLKELWLS